MDTCQTNIEQNLRLLQRAVEASSNGIAMIEATQDGYPVLYANQAFTQITGYTQNEIIGKESVQLLGFSDVQSLETHVLSNFVSDDVYVWVAPTTKKSGFSYWCEYAVSPIRNDSHLITHYVATINDVSNRINYEHHLTYQATHDSLTGLANRVLFSDRVKQAIYEAKRYDQHVGVVLIDLDHFKYVNDTFGHATGDELLRSVAKRLKENVRNVDTVARMGGDEFVVICSRLRSANEIYPMLDRIIESISAPYSLYGHQCNISCSAGVSFFPTNGETPEELLKNSDTSMYLSKDLGRNMYQIFHSSMNDRLSQRQLRGNQLRQALDRDELCLYYQPQIDLENQEIVGVEALLRWKHPELGLLPPERFIPLAEELGLMPSIGEWVLHTACHQVISWNTRGHQLLNVSVNLSKHQLQLKSLASDISRVLSSSSLPPASLTVEFAESAMAEDTASVSETLFQLKNLGINIALDDFGTGYSSLIFLKRLPIDVIKIDPSFIHEIDVNRHDAILTRTIIAMAYSMGLRTVAEGVELPEQAKLLLSWGCNSAQGFLFHDPMDAADICKMLAANSESMGNKLVNGLAWQS